MRTNLLKQLSAIGLFAIGIAGAFVGETGNGSALGTQTNAYRKLNPLGTDCELVKSCQPEFNPIICRVVDGDPASQQLYGMEGGKCVKTLYKYEP